MKKWEEPQWAQDRDREVRERVGPLTPGQARYWRALQEKTVIFCTGPSGAGKTFLPAQLAARGLVEGRYSRLILSRPLVSCGSKPMGWFPGDQAEKCLPYMRPMLEALEAAMGREAVNKHLKSGTIEMCPLETMRGASWKGCFLLLDEAQNAEEAQLRMFLTRLDRGTRMVVTGDITQSDLGLHTPLEDMLARLSYQVHPSVGIVRLGKEDIVRHGLVRWFEARLAGEDCPWVEFDCPACGKACHCEDSLLDVAECWSCKAGVFLTDDLDQVRKVEKKPGLCEQTFPRGPTG